MCVVLCRPCCPRSSLLCRRLEAPNNNGNGLSWLNAKKDVQEAINATSSSADQVWIKAGTYLPTANPVGNVPPVAVSRDRAFYIVDADIKLYGGFAGTETLLSQRNPVTNVTTLSGDLDGVNGTNDAYHVLITGNRTVACVVDGFTISGGRANGSGTVSYSGTAFDRSRAGGIYNISSSPSVNSCIVSSNTAIANGGGMYNQAGSPTMSGCAFNNNTAGQNGGGLLNDNSSPQISNCIFNTNTSGNSGGGLYSLNSNSTTSGCTFSANTAILYGEGIYNEGGNPVISSCTFTSNSTSARGGVLYNLTNALSI